MKRPNRYPYTKPKFRVWHHELGRLMSVKCMFFQDSEIEEFELNDEVVRSEICFEFGKTKYPDSSLFILMEDEQLNFKDFIKSEDFEFEIIGNIYENPELLEDKE